MIWTVPLEKPKSKKVVAQSIKIKITFIRGQNGIRSIISHLGDQSFLRLKIGIGRPESKDSAIVSSWVLGNFSQCNKLKYNN